MKKAFRKVLIVIAAVFGLMIGLYYVMLYETTRHSPQETVGFHENGWDLEVVYSRPQVKDRVIFGGLVPYNQVWRTGANKPTIFRTGNDIRVNGERLPSGEYTLWTIPNQNSWEIIFNSKDYPWGISWKDGLAMRDPMYDEIVVKSTVLPSSMTDTLTIDINYGVMSISWENSRVELSLQPIDQFQ